MEMPLPAGQNIYIIATNVFFGPVRSVKVEKADEEVASEDVDLEEVADEDNFDPRIREKLSN
jgi:hypothetical protein